MGISVDLVMALETIKFPVRYDDYAQKIFDSNNNLIADVRGWSFIQHLSNPEKRQNNVGKFIVDAMNTKYKHKHGVDWAAREKARELQAFY